MRRGCKQQNAHGMAPASSCMDAQAQGRAATCPERPCRWPAASWVSLTVRVMDPTWGAELHGGLSKINTGKEGQVLLIHRSQAVTQINAPRVTKVPAAEGLVTKQSTLRFAGGLSPNISHANTSHGGSVCCSREVTLCKLWSGP